MRTLKLVVAWILTILAVVGVIAVLAGFVGSWIVRNKVTDVTVELLTVGETAVSVGASSAMFVDAYVGASVVTSSASSAAVGSGIVSVEVVVGVGSLPQAAKISRMLNAIIYFVIEITPRNWHLISTAQSGSVTNNPGKHRVGRIRLESLSDYLARTISPLYQL